jgi:glycosyltransferase involved in cell wall biosynthesis
MSPNSEFRSAQPTATMSGNFAGTSAGLAGLRVAIVHYWFIGYGGGERVVEALAEIFPQADLFCLLASKDHEVPALRGRRLTTSFVGRIPGATRWYRHFLLLYPFALEQIDFSNYDLVISSESGPAKGVITSPQTCHICYCHSPMRYIWDMYHESRRSMNPLTRAIFSAAAHYLRLWDFSTAARVDYFVANSNYISARIQKCYRRESSVIHPPTDISAGYICSDIGDYYLVVSRLVPYKRVDLAIAACNRLRRRLQIVGTGPEYKSLRRIAGPTIEFLGKLDEGSLHEKYARCRALLFPGEEDFGLVPVEAQSHGRPVIAYGNGGALETVTAVSSGDDIANCTGLFFQSQTEESLCKAICRFEEVESQFRPQFIRDSMERFSLVRFKAEFADFVLDKMEHFAPPQKSISICCSV